MAVRKTVTGREKCRRFSSEGTLSTSVEKGKKAPPRKMGGIVKNGKTGGTRSLFFIWISFLVEIKNRKELAETARGALRREMGQGG